MSALTGKWVRTIVAALAGLFGAATAFSGGSALFGSADVGNAVPFVLWFNFLAGFAYVLAAVGVFLKRTWSGWLSGGIFLATVAVFAAFAIHIWGGGPYELRTVGAMALRAVFWAAVAYYALRAMKDEPQG